MIQIGFPSGPDEDNRLARATRSLHLGDLHLSRRILADVPSADWTDEHELLRCRLHEMLAARNPDQHVTLVWHMSPQLTEGDWIRWLLQGLYDEEMIDIERVVVRPRMIVVANLLSDEKEAYYRAACVRGARIVLFHLSDECFSDSLSSYRWCSAVYRNCWSPLLAGVKGVEFFPLGYKTGFRLDLPSRPVAERSHSWSFAGDPNKATRRAMIDAMSSVSEGRIHLTSGFFSEDNLGVSDYQAILGDSVFAPCPAGNVNLDSFRVCEALECGAIPIVERRPGFDYFEGLMGPNPMPSVETWPEVVTVLARIVGQDGVAGLQQTCQDWWQDFKKTLKTRIGTEMTSALDLR